MPRLSAELMGGPNGKSVGKAGYDVANKQKRWELHYCPVDPVAQKMGTGGIKLLPSPLRALFLPAPYPLPGS
jgi:hypothetical protein